MISGINVCNLNISDNLKSVQQVVITNPGVAYPLRGPSLGRCLTGQFLRNLVIPNVDDSSDMQSESQINHSLSPKIPMAFPLLISYMARDAVRRKDK